MKRSRLDVGAKSRERGSTFAKPRKPLKASRRVKAIIDKQAAEAWAKAARSKRCVLCRANFASGHHIISQQQLKANAQANSRDLERIRWDRRNLLPLCQRCHGRHHSRMRPVTLQELRRYAPKVFQFAREIGELAWLQRMYPKVNEREL